MKKRILTMMMLLASLSLAAQNNTKVVKGCVTDAATGKPLQGVIVAGYGNSRFTTMTDEQGQYELSVPDYVHSVVMRIEGYNLQQNAIADGVANAKLYSQAFSETYRTSTTATLSAEAVNFENTVIVMTSNAGSEKKENALGFAKTEEDATNEKVRAALSEFLRPEFISRLDEIIIFRHLNEEDFVAISALMLNEYIGSLKEKGINFTYDEKAQKYLAKKAFGGKSGARDLRNLIRKEVEDKIASAIVDHRTGEIAAINVTADDDSLRLEVL